MTLQDTTQAEKSIDDLLVFTLGQKGQEDIEITADDKNIAQMYISNSSFPLTTAHKLSEGELFAFINEYEQHTKESSRTENNRLGYDIAVGQLYKRNWPSW